MVYLTHTYDGLGEHDGFFFFFCKSRQAKIFYLCHLNFIPVFSCYFYCTVWTFHFVLSIGFFYFVFDNFVCRYNLHLPNVRSMLSMQKVATAACRMTVSSLRDCKEAIAFAYW